MSTDGLRAAMYPDLEEKEEEEDVVMYSPSDPAVQFGTDLASYRAASSVWSSSVTSVGFASVRRVYLPVGVISGMAGMTGMSACDGIIASCFTRGETDPCLCVCVRVWR